MRSKVDWGKCGIRYELDQDGNRTGRVIRRPIPPGFFECPAALILSALGLVALVGLLFLLRS